MGSESALQESHWSTHRTSRPCSRLPIFHKKDSKQGLLLRRGSALATHGPAFAGSAFSYQQNTSSHGPLPSCLRLCREGCAYCVAACAAWRSHPVLSSSTAHQTHPGIFQPEPDFTKRVRNATCLVMSQALCSKARSTVKTGQNSHLSTPSMPGLSAAWRLDCTM
jgi:hypothetical protein